MRAFRRCWKRRSGIRSCVPWKTRMEWSRGRTAPQLVWESSVRRSSSGCRGLESDCRELPLMTASKQRNEQIRRSIHSAGLFEVVTKLRSGDRKGGDAIALADALGIRDCAFRGYFRLRAMKSFRQFDRAENVCDALQV